MSKIVKVRDVDSEPEYTKEWFKKKRQEYYQKSIENYALLNAMLEECGLPKQETFHDYISKEGLLDMYQ